MSVFDLYQQQQIRSNSKRVRMAEAEVADRYGRNRDEINNAHARIDRLLLVNEAIWHLVAEPLGFTVEDLQAKIHELDEADGVRDGRRQQVARDCHCGAKINAAAEICMFCSAPAPGGSAFDSI